MSCDNRVAVSSLGRLPSGWHFVRTFSSRLCTPVLSRSQRGFTHVLLARVWVAATATAYLCLLSPFLSRTWGSRKRVEKTTTTTRTTASRWPYHRRHRRRRRCCMQVILGGRLRSLGSTPRPGPTGKNRFLRRALPFLPASSLFAPRVPRLR